MIGAVKSRQKKILLETKKSKLSHCTLLFLPSHFFSWILSSGTGEFGAVPAPENYFIRHLSQWPSWACGSINPSLCLPCVCVSVFHCVQTVDGGPSSSSVSSSWDSKWMLLLLLSHWVTSDSLRPHGLSPTRLLRPWGFPGKYTGVGCHFLLQGLIPTQGLNLCLLHWQVDSLPLSHQGSPKLKLFIPYNWTIPFLDIFKGKPYIFAEE